MKKLIAIPLMILYLASISGVMIQIHFCGQKIQSWSIPYPVERAGCCSDNCATGVVISKNACCQDRVLSLKITQDQLVSAFQFLASDLQTALPATAYNFSEKWGNQPAEHTQYWANAPPKGLWQNLPLFKLHQRFTFYG